MPNAPRRISILALAAAVYTIALVASAGCGSDASEPATWSTAALLPRTSDSIGTIDIAMNDSGDAVVVWGQSPGAEWETRDYAVWAARFTPDDGWSEPTRLSSTSPERTAFKPAVSLNASGHAVVAWSEAGRHPNEPDDEGIWAARFAPDNGWDGRTFIAPGGHSVDVATNDFGQAVIVWADFSSRVWASRLDSASEWTAPTRLDQDCVGVSVGVRLDGVEITSADATAPNVVIGDTGETTVVWDGTQGDGATLAPCEENVSLLSRRFVPGSGWDAAVRLPPRTTNSRFGHLRASLALDGAGRTLTGSLVGQVNTYNATQGWRALDLGYDLARASVATASSGRAILISEITGADDSESYLEAMRAAHFSPDTGWSGPDTIPVVPAVPLERFASEKSPTALDSSGVDVVINDAGRAIVAWHQAGNPTVRSRFSTWATSYDPATGWREPTSFALDDSIEASFPRVAIDAQGRGLAVWHQSPVDGEQLGRARLMWSRFE